MRNTICMQNFFIYGNVCELPADQCSVASATLFPVGWAVEDRIGWSVSALHESVPRWQENLGLPVELYPLLDPSIPT